jgi:Uma2 family endonuclease
MSTMVAVEPRLEERSEMFTTARPRTGVTPEELMAMPDGGHYELIDGELRERRVSALSNLIALETGRILGNYNREHDLGWLFAADHGYQCFPWKPGRIRRADVAFIRRERYSWDEITSDGFTTIAPDLAVEVVSPNDLASKDVEEKIDDYIRAGVRFVWVIHPITRTVYVIRGDGTGYRLRTEDELSGEDVIPGFRCRVADLFLGPDHDESAAPPPSDVTPETFAR